MLYFILCILSFSYVYGGSKCPDRRGIYPCVCIDKPIGKTKFETTVVCQGLTNGESLTTIEPVLAEIDIDHFLLYDSYWSSHSRLLQANARIPVNYVTTFKMTEVKVVDTVLSTFGCPHTDNCRTSFLKRFFAENSSLSESSDCNNHFSINSWISCPETIEVVVINQCYKSEISLKPDFFPDRLTKLKELRMPNNKISKIERRTFNDIKFPALQTLDLSNNLLREVKILFSSALKLKHLDLSFNTIRTVLDFQYLPQLQFLNLSNNHIHNLLQNEWANIPSSLRTIDLRNNDLECNCAFKWVNSTFHINANLLGDCVSPSEVAKMKLRRASRLLNERCDENNKILPSKIKHTAASGK